MEIKAQDFTICSVIYELLSPTGRHYQGTLYLKLFFKEVLRIDISEDELMDAVVYRDYVVERSGKQIDLVIQTSKYFIPIEVKVFAEDNKNQYYDYYMEAKEKIKNSQYNPVLFYISRFGDNPDETSVSGLTKTDTGYKEIVNISLLEDILKWISACIKEPATIRIAPFRDIMLQFLAMIRKFKITADDRNSIEELIVASPENMKSVTAVQSSVDEARKNLMVRLFEAVDQKVSSKYQRLINEYDYAENNFQKINKYYENRRRTLLPGINYLYKQNVKKNTDVWVRLEIDWYVYVGYCCVVDRKAGKQQVLSEDEIKEILKVEPVIDRWWAYWEYCPEDNDAKSPNFKEFDENWYNLFNKKHFDEFVESCADRILYLLER